MTPSGILKLSSRDRDESLIVYLDIDEDVLKDRLMSREDADNWERRLIADRNDFSNFKNFDVIVKESNFTGDFEWLYNFKINEND